MGNSNSTYLQGRLKDPNMSPATDPRIDVRLRKIFEQFQMAQLVPDPEDDLDKLTLDECIKMCQEVEQQSIGLTTMLYKDLPVPEGVEVSQESIKGVDGNDIVLYISKPKTASQATQTCIVHTHGGGMALLNAADLNYRYWCNMLAVRGLVVVSVEFRNSGGNRCPPAAYPAGLNDCVSAIKWVINNKSKLGISKIVTHGESGGGNLALAGAMKAATEGFKVDGVYACCPNISNCFDGSKPEELISLKENDGYFLNIKGCYPSARTYTEKNTPQAKDGFAWPYHCTDEQLKTLPKTIISVNELDPLRDEGLVLGARLRALGVGGYTTSLAGTTHAAESMFAPFLPDLAAAVMDGVRAFCDTV